MRGSICHLEIATTDIEKTTGFLSRLFGWELGEESPDYWFFKPAEGPGGGIEKVDTHPGRGGIQFYVHVDSIEETLETARELGGRVEKPRTEIGGGHGSYALVGDPGGTVLGIWQPEAS